MFLSGQEVYPCENCELCNSGNYHRDIDITILSVCLSVCLSVRHVPTIVGINYLVIQRSVWRDIKLAFVFLFVCTVEDISTQDSAIGVKFWLRVEQTS